MLCFLLHRHEAFWVGGAFIKVTYLGTERVELSIQADRSIPVYRQEVLHRIARDQPDVLAKMGYAVDHGVIVPALPCAPQVA